ncbi:MAG: hypothetical protein V1810_05030 [Candidatus Beckwithbacteria bacterium]
MSLIANTYSKVEVNNQVEGGGKVYTYIETEVNGQRQVLEASEPGSYKLEMGTPIIKEERDNNLELETKNIETIKPKKEIVRTSQNNFHSLVNQIEKLFQKLIRNIYRLFH